MRDWSESASENDIGVLRVRYGSSIAVCGGRYGQCQRDSTGVWAFHFDYETEPAVPVWEFGVGGGVGGGEISCDATEAFGGGAFNDEPKYGNAKTALLIIDGFWFPPSGCFEQAVEAGVRKFAE